MSGQNMQTSKPFDGRTENYSEFKAEIERISKTLSTDPFGLYPLVVNDMEFLKVTGTLRSLYPAKQHPGPEPIETDFKTRKDYISESELYYKKLKRYGDYILNVNKLKELYLSSIDQASLTMLKSGCSTDASLGDMIAKMNEFYGVLTPAAFERGTSALYVAFNSVKSTMRQYVGTHINAHSFIADNTTEPMRNIEKVRLLRNGVEKSNNSSFQLAIDDYNRKRKSVNDQTFAELSDLLIQVDKSKRITESVVTVETLGYSAAEAKEVSNTHPHNDDIDKFAAAVAKSLAKTYKMVPAAAKASDNKYNSYCHTHGTECGHTSANCNKPKPGHKREATAENKMNGNETKFKPYFKNK